jgi:hypothetical protein
VVKGVTKKQNKDRNLRSSLCLALFVTRTKKEKPMTKLRILGALLVVFPVLAEPAMAKPAAKHPAQVCDPRDPGNPFSERYDYMTWAAWRRRGGWDTRAEWTCQPIPEYARRPGFDVGPR